MRDRGEVRVDERDLVELRARVRSARPPRPFPVAQWAAGSEPADVKRLARYWAGGFDWRGAEARINALPSKTAVIDDRELFFLQFDGEGNAPFPIILTHGWPSSFLEMVRIAERLSQPSQFGGGPEDAFTVIVPALPGFPFSQSRELDATGQLTHELWHKLMCNELGFTKYAAHGGDLGAGITTRLAQAHPESVVAIHILAVADPIGPIDDLTQDERDYLASEETWMRDEGGYEHLQRTRPATVSYALSDSPVGLLAWILEKYRAWSDCDGDLGSKFSDDYLLTQASLYWFENSIATSFFPYFAYAQGLTGQVISVTVPTAVAVFPHDLVLPPRSWAERTYNVVRYTRMPRGGHFAAHEEPELLSNDIVEFLRPYRELE
jgi:pimeloyl-ACP methyl ester carboxylesterase